MLLRLEHILKVVVVTTTLFICLSSTYAQKEDWWSKKQFHSFQFINPRNNTGGFDKPEYKEWNSQFEMRYVNDTTLIPPIQSVITNTSFEVKLLSSISYDPNLISWRINDSLTNPTYRINGDTIIATFPGIDRFSLLEFRYKQKTYALLEIRVFKPIIEHLVVVGLESIPYTRDFQKLLDSVFVQAGIQVVISNSTIFNDTLFAKNKVFQNPTLDHTIYTSEMRQLRDRFFERFPTSDKNSYYLFLINNFKDTTLNAYSAMNKAISFVKRDAFIHEPKIVIQELARSIGMLKNSWVDNGPIKGTTNNLMDIGSGIDLNAVQWLQLRHSARTFSYYDSDEEVLTNNGLVAYYFWEEDENGNILLTDKDPLKSLVRPFKKNYFSYHLNITEKLYTTAFTIWNIPILWWHIILWFAATTLLIPLRIRQIRNWKTKNITGLNRKTRSLLFFGLMATIYYGSFLVINFELRDFEISEGIIKEFEGASFDKVRSQILYNTDLKHTQQNTLRSELLIKRGKEWTIKKTKPVLYFDVNVDNEGTITKMKFVRSSDTLASEKIEPINVFTHYFVLRFINSNHEESFSKVYNHLGYEISPQFEAEDPAKRILLFVNGYRPTSIGHDFQDNFEDVIEKGLEFKESGNMIYTFDRYDYWQPWQAIDDKFKEHINPQETYYADGHFSVSTSNYKSLFNFTKTAASYPQRCKNPNKHTCNELLVNTRSLFGNKKSHTTSILPTKSNKRGFEYRMDNGRVAGKNLLSILNDVPGFASNDTVYIVAHSMGYAYALGIIEELRNYTNFGGFIILAPENASAGSVNKNEWSFVWQYGSNLTQELPACLQDGIAPQSCVKGLTNKERCYFPEIGWYNKQGFYNSHFVGYYTWIFSIKAGQKGYIPQR